MSKALTLPPGRLMSDAYKLAPKTDNNNKPVIGADGLQVHTSFVCVAIPKNPGEAAWWDTAWGKEILTVGAADMPNAYRLPGFAWKIEDGDSAAPNKKGKMNKDREGFPGHWIVKASSTFLPQVCTLLHPSSPGKPVTLVEKNAVTPGNWVQLAVTVAGNNRTDSPGVYVNPNIVCMVAYGPPIAFGMDPEEAGFGTAPLPAGASLTPLAVTMPATAAAPAPAVPPVGTPAVPAPAAPVAPVAPVAVAPHPTILAPPAPAAPAPPAPAGPVMTAKANGITYEAFIGQGWTPDALRAHGYMV